MSKKNNSYNFDFIEVILFLYRHWKQLLIICLIAVVVSYVASSPIFITPKYKSTATFYPGTTNSISSALFYNIRETAQDPLAFADQEVTEQYLQLLQSADLRERVMTKFHLMEHYKIDTAKKNKYRKLNDLYDKNVKISRTDFNSVQVTVLDEEPAKAAELANGIMFTVDEMRHEVQSRVARQIFTIVEEEYHNKLHYIDSIKTRLKELGAEGVYDLTNQSKGISEVVGKGQPNKYTQNESKKLGEYGGEVFLLNQLLEVEAERIVLLNTKYTQAKIDMDAKLSNIFVVSYASPSDDKAYPIRSIIVFMSVLSAFILGCVVLVVLDKMDNFKQIINSGK